MKNKNQIKVEISDLLQEVEDIKTGKVYYGTQRKENSAINKIKNRLEFLDHMLSILTSYDGNGDFLIKSLVELRQKRDKIISQFEYVKHNSQLNIKTINEFKRIRGVPELDRKIKALSYIIE